MRAALECTWKAATTACGVSDFHRRVEYAVGELNSALDKDFPPELLPLRDSIEKRCTKHESIPDSVPNLTEREAKDVLHRILELYVQVQIAAGAAVTGAGSSATRTGRPPRTCNASLITATSSSQSALSI